MDEVLLLDNYLLSKFWLIHLQPKTKPQGLFHQYKTRQNNQVINIEINLCPKWNRSISIIGKEWNDYHCKTNDDDKCYNNDIQMHSSSPHKNSLKMKNLQTWPWQKSPYIKINLLNISYLWIEENGNAIVLNWLDFANEWGGWKFSDCEGFSWPPSWPDHKHESRELHLMLHKK